MAVTTPRRRTKDPEGRMPLREHFAELRRRLLISAAAIAVGAVAGWFAYDWVFTNLINAFHAINQHAGRDARITFSDLTSPLNLHIKLAVYLGVVIASPVWLYQVWAFVTPGLTRKERKYAYGFVGAGVPLFLAGLVLAWEVLPNAIKVLTSFTPNGVSNYVDAETLITFATRLMLAFGLAFVVPLLFVALNLAGLMSGAALGRHWRIAVFACFLFAAIASPSPDAGSMLLMAFPMVGLYVLAVGVCLLNDRRRARRRAADPLAALGDDEASQLGDDEAAHLEAGPTGIEQPSPLEELFGSEDPRQGS